MMDQYDYEKTPVKRNPLRRTVLNNYKSPLRLPGRAVTFKPRTPTGLSRQTNVTSSIGQKRESLDDFGASSLTGSTLASNTNITPRRTSTRRSFFYSPRTLYNIGNQGADAGVTKSRPVTATRTLPPTRINQLREALDQKNSENQRLKAEIDKLKIDAQLQQSKSNAENNRLIEELERIKLQNGRLARENEQIKKVQFDGKDALIAEIHKRDEYIKASNEHHAKAFENLKEKASAEITAKSSMVTMLNGKVKELMDERAQYTEKICKLRDKHAQESSDLIKKMTQLVEERNRLINTNLSQKQIIEDMMKRMDGKENSSKVNEDRLRHLMSTFESMERHKK